MEDALVPDKYLRISKKDIVLILVLMEDALVHYIEGETKVVFVCLNPCFNGRCTRTSVCMVPKAAISLCLNPCFNGRCTRTLDTNTAVKLSVMS